MKRLGVIVGMTVVCLSLPGLVRAESLNSKLIDALAATAGSSEATSKQQEVAAAPADEVEKQALEAGAQDAIDQALKNARDGQK